MFRSRSIWMPLMLLAVLGTSASARQHHEASPAAASVPHAFQPYILPNDTLLGRQSLAVRGGTIDAELRIFRTAHTFHTVPAPYLSPAEAAHTVVSAEASRFGWEPNDLQIDRVDRTPGGVHVLYRQIAGGIPVYNRFVRLTMGAENRPVYLASDYLPVIAPEESRARLSADDARSIARNAVSSEGALTEQRGMVVYPSDPARLAWRIIAWPEDIPAEWEVLVDASTGEIIFLIETTLRLHARVRSDSRPKTSTRSDNPPTTDGSGLVFRPDPLTTAGALYGGFYVNNNDADTDELNAERVLVPLRDITRGDDDLFRLEGPHVRIVGRNATNREVYTPPAEAYPDSFRYTRSDDFFEAVNVYYHIDSSQRYVQSLGFSSIQNTPIEANPHGEGQKDQSLYHVNQNFLSYGSGNVDDAEDADVILHEYGHALLEATSPGMSKSPEGSAIHEGWADYWAASYRRHLVETASVPEHDWRRLFRWDSGYHGDGSTPWTYWPGREVNHSGRYPDDLIRNKWTDGLLLATTLMQIFDEMGRERSDALNLQAQHFLTAGSTMPDYARALIKADRLLHNSAYSAGIIDIVADRGFIDRDEYGPIIAHVPPEGMHQPGAQVRIEVSAASMAADIQAVQFHHRVAGSWQSPMNLTQENDTLFSLTWTLPQTEQLVAYYISARDRAGMAAMLPADAPDEAFRITIGVDADPPEVEHAPIVRASITGWPVEVSALASDASGVDSVWVEFSVLREGSEVQGGTFGLSHDGGYFHGLFDLPASSLEAGDEIAYRIIARDEALPPNTGKFPQPTNPPFVFRIEDSELIRHFSFEGPERAVNGSGQWGRGKPAHGIFAPYTGTQSWGTNLSGPYEADASLSSLLLGELDLSRFDSAYLVFYHWYQTPASGNEAAGGGNIRISVDGGSEWLLASPLEGYAVTVSSAGENPLAGEPAYGGLAPNWRRGTIPLPAEDRVRVRFDFGAGSDASGDLEGRSGWFIDEVSIVKSLDPDPSPPRFSHLPQALAVADPTTAPPPVTVRAESGAGIDHVSGYFDLTDRDGQLLHADSLSFRMDPGDPHRYLAEFPIDTTMPGTGARIAYRILAVGFDGEVASAPPAGSPPFKIEYRRRDRLDLLAKAVRTGHWNAGAGYWQIGPAVTEASASSLIPAPMDLPENLAEAVLSVDHRFELDSGAGGNVKISTDGGSSWRILEPAGGYSSGIVDNGAVEPVFGGASGPDAQRAYFDLLPYAGEQVRLRLDFRATRPLTSGEFWMVNTAEAAYSTLDDDFETPRTTALHPNFPNPFDGTTTITYTVARSGPVEITVYDVMGREIATLVSEEHMEGTHSLTLDGTNLANGLYFVRLQSNGQTHVRKVSLVR